MVPIFFTILKTIALRGLVIQVQRRKRLAALSSARVNTHPYLSVASIATENAKSSQSKIIPEYHKQEKELSNSSAIIYPGLVHAATE